MHVSQQCVAKFQMETLFLHVMQNEHIKSETKYPKQQLCFAKQKLKLFQASHSIGGTPHFNNVQIVHRGKRK